MLKSVTCFTNYIRSCALSEFNLAHIITIPYWSIVWWLWFKYKILLSPTTFFPLNHSSKINAQLAYREDWVMSHQKVQSLSGRLWQYYKYTRCFLKNQQELWQLILTINTWECTFTVILQVRKPCIR